MKFPHHENEIAQSEAVNHTRLANYWMHVGFLLTDGVKMSKSLGNSILAKDVLERHSGNSVRLFFLSTHYRAPINYTEENLNNCDKQIAKYQNSYRKGVYKLELSGNKEPSLLIEDYEESMNALADDLNVSNCMTVVDRLIKSINSESMKKDTDTQKLSNLLYTFHRITSVLGLVFDVEPLTDEDKENYKQYNQARAEKDYAKSDIYRKKLLEKGIL